MRLHVVIKETRWATFLSMALNEELNRWRAV
jgi:hypothetical protein